MEELPSLFHQLSKVLDRGEVLFRQGDRGREMYVIYSGKVALSVQAGEGTEAPIATLGPGEFFGEMSLIDGSPRSATATIDENGTRLIVLDRTRFEYIIRHEPEFALIVMQTLCERIRAGNPLYARSFLVHQQEQ